MENKVYMMDLYDLYGDLFTDKQRLYFVDYYCNDLSLAEIGENNEISRNAVHKQVKEVAIKLQYYEEKLGLYDKKKKIYAIMNDIKDSKIKEKIEEII